MEKEDLFTEATRAIESATQQGIKNLSIQLLKVDADEGGNTRISFSVRFVPFGSKGITGTLVSTALPEGGWRYDFLP